MNPKIQIRALLLFLIVSAVGFAETDNLTTEKFASEQHFVISQIQIMGNAITKPFVILKEIQTRPGDVVTLARLESDRKRIESLGIFNYVEMELVREEETAKLVITVTEQWYVYPYPVIKRIEKSWDKFSFGGGFKYKNFRGRNEHLQLEGYRGYRDQLKFEYTIPWLFQHRNISVAFGAFWENRKGNSQTVEAFMVDQFTVSTIIGRRFGYHTSFSLGGGFSAISIAGEKTLTLSSGGQDKFPLLQTIFTFDTRDYVYYPHQGTFINLYATQYGYSGNAVNYQQYGADFRKYVPLPKGTVLAGKIAFDKSRGTVPIYNQFFLGYDFRLRGHYYEHHEGENRLMAGAEFRFPILPVDHYSLYQDTAFENLFKDLKFGISGAFFYDTGSVWNQDIPLRKKQLLHGFGFGLNFHVPYLEILRLEYAVNTNFSGEAILFDVELAI